MQGRVKSSLAGAFLDTQCLLCPSAPCSDEGSAAEEEDESSGEGDSDEPDTPLRSARTETLAFSHSVVPSPGCQAEKGGIGSCFLS